MAEHQNKNIVVQFANEEIARQVKFCKSKFDLDEDWHPYVKLSCYSKTKASQAGRNILEKPFMCLELASFCDNVTGFLEYDAYTNNMLIGSFKSTDWETCLRALISHELSHCIQYTISYSKTSLRDSTTAAVAFHGLGEFHEGQTEAHGKFFQSIYRELRKEFVNQYIGPYCMGIEPQPIPTSKHPLVGKSFHHIELGKCTMIDYNERARKYKYKYMDRKGIVYQSDEAVMASDADWDFYNNLDL